MGYHRLYFGVVIPKSAHKICFLAKVTKLSLTLKMPGKPASENVVCLCCLLNILANFSNLFLHTEEQSDLGQHCLQKRLLKSQTDDKADDNCCDWQFKG